jgi:hypothetical protein
MPHAPHPTFSQVYDCLRKQRPATVISSRGTRYKVEARPSNGRPTIIGTTERNGKVRIHEDCWGHPTTCAGTRTGGLLNGHPSLDSWYAKTCGKRSKGKGS